MNNDIRSLYLDLIDVVNKYENVPWEARRLALQVVQDKAEQQADACIKQELANTGIHVGTIILEGGEDAKDIYEN